jgi:nitrate reductase NapE component
VFQFREFLQSSDSNWANQQTEKLERKIKLLDFACLTIFPLIFLTFNFIYWMLQYSQNFLEMRRKEESGYTGIH